MKIKGLCTCMGTYEDSYTLANRLTTLETFIMIVIIILFIHKNGASKLAVNSQMNRRRRTQWQFLQQPQVIIQYIHNRIKLCKMLARETQSLGKINFLCNPKIIIMSEWVVSWSHIKTYETIQCHFRCYKQLKGSVKEPNKFHIYETEKITRKASDGRIYRVVRFFHPRSSCTTHLVLFSECPPIYASSCVTISGERTEQLDIFCHVTGFTSDFRLPHWLQSIRIRRHSFSILTEFN